MEQDKQTKQNLIECAKKEFIEKGYMKASLRTICKNAGVTTGALYFFFEDKDALFQSVVERPIQELFFVLKNHFSQELQGFDPEMGNLEDDFKAVLGILATAYKYKEEFELVLNRAQGSQYENIVDDIVELIYQHYLEIYWRMKKYRSARQLKQEDKFIVHWMAHDHIDMFIHLLTHCKDEKDARKQAKNMFNYMIGGWRATIDRDII